LFIELSATASAYGGEGGDTAVDEYTIQEIIFTFEVQKNAALNESYVATI